MGPHRLSPSSAPQGHAPSCTIRLTGTVRPASPALQCQRLQTGHAHDRPPESDLCPPSMCNNVCRAGEPVTRCSSGNSQRKSVITPWGWGRRLVCIILAVCHPGHPHQLRSQPSTLSLPEWTQAYLAKHHLLRGYYFLGRAHTQIMKH